MAALCSSSEICWSMSPTVFFFCRGIIFSPFCCHNEFARKPRDLRRKQRSTRRTVGVPDHPGKQGVFYRLNRALILLQGAFLACSAARAAILLARSSANRLAKALSPGRLPRIRARSLLIPKRMGLKQGFVHCDLVHYLRPYN